MSIRKQAISGLKWTTVSTITLTVVNILKISVLARFLDKSDFGLMALVTFVLGFMNLFMDLGLTSAILHCQVITKKEYASLYWINIFLSLLLFGLVIILSPFIANLYNEPELKVLIPIMSISIMFSAIGSQFRTIEQKELHFRYLGLVEIISAICGLVTGVFLAVFGYGIYSLVYGSLMTYAISNIIFFVKGIISHGMLFHFRFRETKSFLRIGIYQVGGQIINYFTRDFDILIIGKFMGSEVLGGYSLAKQLVRSPMSIIDPIINKVGVSIFPKYQNNIKLLRLNFLKIVESKAIINAFLYTSISILAVPLVKMFYGNMYISIVPYVQLFTILIFLRSMGSIVGIIVITTGRTNYEFYWNIIVSIITPLAIYIGAQYSVQIIIISMAIVQLILLTPNWYVFYKKLMDLDFFSYLKAIFVPSIISSLIAIFAILFFNNNLYLQIISIVFLSLLLIVYSYHTIEEVKKIVFKFSISYFHKFYNRKEL